MKVTLSCPALCHSMNYTVHGILQARILEWVAFPFSGDLPNPGLPHCKRILYQLSYKGSPRILEWVAYPFSRRSPEPRNWTRVSYNAGRFFTNWPIMVAYLIIGIRKAEICRVVFYKERWLVRVPWTARRSNQSILKEISPEYSLGGLMLKLKVQYFGHLMRRADSFEKTLMLGKVEGRRRDDRGWDGWMASPTQWTWVWVNSRSWWWTGSPTPAVVHGVTELDMTEWLNWTTG